MKNIKGGVTSAKGYLASGIHGGIKKKNKDLALVYSEVPAVGAGVFTQNVVKASPVLWDMKIAKESANVQAVILNSGVANACTGELGNQNNEMMATEIANELGLKANEVFTASTGVIGQQLPIELIVESIKELKDKLAKEEGGKLAAEAIMTTDTHSKEAAVELNIDGKTVTVGGMAKGSGMIHPNMATMLSVITTDIAISKELLNEALKEDVKDSFNMISVDRDSSTNDSVLVLANGLAGNEEITAKGDNYRKFCQALKAVTIDLSKQIAADGEGATKLFEMTVKGAKTKDDAVNLSKSIITSNLVKAALFGNDANWGRILCAMGYAGVEFDPNKVDLCLESENEKIKIVEQGVALDFSEEDATRILSREYVIGTANINSGEETATAWGCDLTYDYVKINGDYRS